MSICRDCVFWEPNQRIADGMSEGLNKTLKHKCRHYKMNGLKFGGSAHQQSNMCPFFIPDKPAKLLPNCGIAYKQ